MTTIDISDSKNIDVTKLIPIHPVRSSEKVDSMVKNFDAELATPILVDEAGRLLNGTHRYNAFLKRFAMGCDDNFTITPVHSLNCWVGSAIQEYLEEGGVNMYIDIDHFWNDNWFFSDAYEQC